MNDYLGIVNRLSAVELAMLMAQGWKLPNGAYRRHERIAEALMVVETIRAERVGPMRGIEAQMLCEAGEMNDKNGEANQTTDTRLATEYSTQAA